MNEYNNKVELIGYYGSDEIIALSAWTSTSRNLDDNKRARIPALINQLWSAEPVPHKSPFEKGIVHFLVDTDIATHIHLLKHRIASINGESARYKELVEDKYYIPQDWLQDQETEEDQELLSKWWWLLMQQTEHTNKLYHECLNELTPLLGRKRAKESARYFKMYNSQIQADVMFNMSSFNNFLTQRRDNHAQDEIWSIADRMLSLVRNIEGNPFEYTIKAWKLNI